MPCGNEVAPTNEARELWKSITFDPELSFEHDDSRWKALDEQKTMVPLRRGFEMIEEKKNLIPHPLKRVLRGLGVLHLFEGETSFEWISNTIITLDKTFHNLLSL
jgi:hypothetical protein